MGGMVEGRSHGRISVRLERTQVGGAERRMKQPKQRGQDSDSSNTASFSVVSGWPGHAQSRTRARAPLQVAASYPLGSDQGT